MKKLLVGLITILFLYSCGHTKTNIPNEDTYIFSEKSELRIFRSELITTKSSEGLFVVALGSYSSTEYTKTVYKFYAKAKDGQYIYFEINPSDIGFILDSTVITPYVVFDHLYTTIGDQQNSLIDIWANRDNKINRVKIYCKPELIPQNLLLSL